MLTSKAVKKFAKAHGADLVGIGSMDRWEGAPKIRDPRFIFLEAKTCISLAFRIPRGYFRGIEEGPVLRRILQWYMPGSMKSMHRLSCGKSAASLKTTDLRRFPTRTYS